MENKSFSFIGEIIKSEILMPIHLFEGYYLNRASLIQQKQIKSRIEPFFKIMLLNINKYEMDFVAKDEGYSSINLESEYFNYFVIEHFKAIESRILNTVISLSKINLTLLLEVNYLRNNQYPDLITPALKYYQLKTFNYYNDSSEEIPFKKTFVDQESINEIRKIYNSLQKIDLLQYPIIDKAIIDFISIRDISIESPFRILSYFSILELLLTSYKRGSSNDSSISIQLQKKIKLINNQMDSNIDFELYFKGPNSNSIETIIEKLYQFRNNIAHGNFSDFDKDLQIVKNNISQVLPFLHEILRCILVEAIQKPKLIMDLKEC